MDLPLTEPVEVAYGHSMIVPDPNSTDLCTLENGSLECIDAYTHRISPILKLGSVNLSDSGVYTIQSKSRELFLVYNVSVKGMSPLCVCVCEILSASTLRNVLSCHDVQKVTVIMSFLCIFLGDQPKPDKEKCYSASLFWPVTGLLIAVIIVLGALCIYCTCKKQYQQNEPLMNGATQSDSVCWSRRNQQKDGESSPSSSLMES